jgi:hypothetical protein
MENVQVHVRIQKRLERIQRQLSQPNNAKDPEERKNYKQVPKSSATRSRPTSPSPAAAAVE